MKLHMLAWTLVATALLIGPTHANAQEFTSQQRSCFEGVWGRAEGVLVAQWDEMRDCVSSNARRALDPNSSVAVFACFLADASGRVANRRASLADRFEADCVGVDPDGEPALPPFGVTNPATIGTAFQLAPVTGFASAIGFPDSLLVQRSEDRATATCQVRAVKAVERCQRHKMRDLRKCTIHRVRKGFVSAPDDFEPCFEDEAASLNTLRSCGDPETVRPNRADRLRRTLNTCVNRDVALEEAFPACGSSADAEATHACMVRELDCVNCLRLESAMGIDFNCDLADNHVEDASCP